MLMSSMIGIDQSNVKNSVKIGVVDIPIIHSSPGLTNPNKEFYEGQKYFINKWKK